MQRFSERGSVDEVFTSQMMTLIAQGDQLGSKNEGLRGIKTNNFLPSFFVKSDMEERINRYVEQHLYDWQRRVSKGTRYAAIGALGKRKRCYEEIQEEEEFLSRCTSSVLKKVPLLRDWSELLHHYCDSHDGYYREWSLLRSSSSCSCSSSSSFSSSSSSPHFSLGLPPVPIHQQHPASWGFRSRTSPTLLAEPQAFHPAACSVTIAPLPGALLSRCKGDLDDISIELERAEFLLMQQEMCNTLQLDQLALLVERDALTTSLKERCRGIDEGLISIYNAVLTGRSSSSSCLPRATYVPPFVFTILCIFYNTLMHSRMRDSSHFLGACRLHHVPGGAFIQALKVGDEVEFYEGGLWSIGHITQLRVDNGLLRLVKVAPTNGSPEDKVWIGVEDSRLASVGTHTSLRAYATVESHEVVEETALRGSATVEKEERDDDRHEVTVSNEEGKEERVTGAIVANAEPVIELSMEPALLPDPPQMSIPMRKRRSQRLETLDAAGGTMASSHKRPHKSTERENFEQLRREATPSSAASMNGTAMCCLEPSAEQRFSNASAMSAMS